MNWIPVSERLPDDDICVLIATPDTVWIGFISDSAWYWADGGKILNQTVTHWQDLPEAPL